MYTVHLPTVYTRDYTCNHTSYSCTVKSINVGAITFKIASSLSLKASCYLLLFLGLVVLHFVFLHFRIHAVYFVQVILWVFNHFSCNFPQNDSYNIVHSVVFSVWQLTKSHCIRLTVNEYQEKEDESFFLRDQLKITSQTLTAVLCLLMTVKLIKWLNQLLQCDNNSSQISANRPSQIVIHYQIRKQNLVKRL